MAGIDNVQRRQLAPGGFRPVTNMKAAPNSQGTLFQGGNPTPRDGKARWPRGYSPERRDEVVQAMDSWQDMPGSGNYPKVHAYLGPKHVTRGLSYKGPGTAEVAAGVGVVARSTVPAEHIRGVRYHFNQPDRWMDDAAGSYTPAGKRWGLLGEDRDKEYPTEANIRIAQGHASGTTVIHEIGHHVSAITGTPHSASQRAGKDIDPEEHYRQRGEEEGFAENYAETHFRDRRGRPIALETSASKWDNSYGMSADWTDPRRKEFGRGFYQKRAEGPNRVHVAREAEYHRRQNPSGIEGQQELLHREEHYRDDDSHVGDWEYTDEQYRAGLRRGPYIWEDRHHG